MKSARQAYWSLVFKDKRSGNLSWHLNNLLWEMASCLHFGEQEVFGLWVNCALFDCGEGLREAARKYYGKRLPELSRRELAGLVVLVRSSTRFKPGSEGSEKRINEILEKVRIHKERSR